MTCTEKQEERWWFEVLPSISYLTLTCRVTFPDDEKLKVYWSEESHLIGWVGHSYIALTPQWWSHTPLARLAAHLMMVITRNFDKTFCWEQTKTLLLILTRMVLTGGSYCKAIKIRKLNLNLKTTIKIPAKNHLGNRIQKFTCCLGCLTGPRRRPDIKQ